VSTPRAIRVALEENRQGLPEDELLRLVCDSLPHVKQASVKAELRRMRRHGELRSTPGRTRWTLA
jgi:hypothetical protein